MIIYEQGKYVYFTLRITNDCSFIMITKMYELSIFPYYNQFEPVLLYL